MGGRPGVLAIAAFLSACALPTLSLLQHDAAPDDAGLDDAGLDDAPDDDAPPDAPPCDPVAQTGCATDQKCTWVATSPSGGYVGCVQGSGAAAEGAACTYGAGGVDNCVKGTLCDDFCKRPCTSVVMCDANHVCTATTSNAARASQVEVCSTACNPLEDNDFDGAGADAKGSNICGTAANIGCYGFPSQGIPPSTGWSCATDYNVNQSQPVGLRHRVSCGQPNNCMAGGSVYINSCNQGYLPLLQESTGSTTTICVAMCKPAVCYSGNCGSGTSPPSQRPGVSPHRCNVTDRVGTFATTEHCQYLWWREVDNDGNFLQSPTSDSVGFCYDTKKYHYDSNLDGQLNASDLFLPNCNELVGSGFGSGSDPLQPTTYFGAADLGCVPTDYLPPMFTGKSRIPPESLRKRQLMNLPRTLYRRMTSAPTIQNRMSTDGSD